MTSAPDWSVARRVSGRMQVLCREVDRAVEAHAGERVPFTLIVWTDGRWNYASSTTDRAWVRERLREMLAAWDAEMPDVPAHEVQ